MHRCYVTSLMTFNHSHNHSLSPSPSVLALAPYPLDLALVQPHPFIVYSRCYVEDDAIDDVMNNVVPP